MGCNLFLHCLREVVPQMPTVGDLDRLRRPNTGGFGIRVGAITADHLGGRMNGEPFGDGAGFPVGENIDWTVSIQIDQNGPIPMPSPQREIVDTEHRDQSFSEDQAMLAPGATRSSVRRKLPAQTPTSIMLVQPTPVRSFPVFRAAAACVACIDLTAP